ncbi:hypothetical protein [Flagellimonas crocea]|uniref:hypothetical protein n=1 Tax=Flagellimonas crocea TaxID=3067311 RepID=UPI00296F3453|nr:hypothetical protein [Muricauda sp. DH64]
MGHRFFTILCVLSISLVSCKDSGNSKENNTTGADTFRSVTIDGEYKIDIPKFMTGTTGLNEEASLQFQSLIEEAYLLVIDEPKSGFEKVYKDLEQYDDHLSILQNYRNARLQILSRSTHINKKSSVQPLKINGLNAETLQIDTSIQGVPQEISYFLTFVEGEEKVYMIMAWTIESKKEELKPTFEQVAQSFAIIS